MPRILIMIMTREALFVIGALLLALALAGCWEPDNPLRAGQPGPGIPSGSAHNVNIDGTYHASGYCQPFLNCSACHGDSLQGGSAGQPSCTKCHADHWNEATCETIPHTVNFDGHLHAPGYCQPFTNCAQCHGGDLRGGTTGQPSCYECHDAKWAGGECGD